MYERREGREENAPMTLIIHLDHDTAEIATRQIHLFSSSDNDAHAEGITCELAVLRYNRQEFGGNRGLEGEREGEIA